jgi:hypothetical protein
VADFSAQNEGAINLDENVHGEWAGGTGPGQFAAILFGEKRNMGCSTMIFQAAQITTAVRIP